MALTDALSVAKALAEFATSSYRTYVLNDAAIVSKARFYIMSENLNSSGQFELEKILPVQINPSEMEAMNSYKRVKQKRGLTGDSVIDRVFSAHAGDEGHDHDITIKLNYNIYDEYKAATMDGMLGALTSMSLDDEDTTSLRYLINCVPSNALFLWGDMQIFGVISHVGYSYTAFSRWGNPLAATADIVIKEQRLSSDIEKKPLETTKISSIVSGSIKSMQKVEEITNTAALLATAAMR
ncbi:MAG: hypothetical protein LBR79_02705 [Oscillospiraceae bacterium]|jgi:hypothetical protein|nr:hypothetical protein [Oscillospiraceae bacterium]